ncbi:ABC transporter substrate-binding protein [Paracoccus sp. (in: a-proteobacteria)]|uniref:ABC transporter substrate-binding protein n=1 Tax=Paracoccus sp. TaxID=267 RepID=UPI003A8AC751
MRRLAIACAVMLCMAAGGPGPDAVARFGDAGAPRRLVVRAAADIAFFAPVIKAFIATRPGLLVEWQDWNTNALYDRVQADCAAGSEGADLIFSSAADLQVALVNAGCARPHFSDLVQALPPERNWCDELFGMTEEPVVMVFNRAGFPEGSIPQSRFDLLDMLRRDSRLDGRIATYDIETSGVGYLFAFQDSLHASTFGSLLEAFGRAGAVATCCSAEIIEQVRSGHFLVAYNILGSYAFSVARDDPSLRVVMPSDYTLVLHRAAFIAKDARNPAQAGEFIDFMLSPDGQRVMQRQGLIISHSAAGDDPIRDDLIPAGASRPIQLSPALRLGQDAMKRAAFRQTWNTRIATRPVGAAEAPGH